MKALPRAVLVGVSASVAIFIAASIWFVASALAPVLNPFFGGWLLACALEPCVAGIMRVARARRPTAVLAPCALELVVVAIGWSLAAPAMTRQVDDGVTSLRARVGAVADHGVAGQLDFQSGLRDQQLGLQLYFTATPSLSHRCAALATMRMLQS